MVYYNTEQYKEDSMENITDINGHLDPSNSESLFDKKNQQSIKKSDKIVY
jgi:hypothetical protein